MKAILKTFLLTALMAVSGLWTANAPQLLPHANNQVTVKLVLGEGATLPGYLASNDVTIFHHNVVTYTALAESILPTPQKPGTTFVSWVFAQSSALVRVNRMPKTSGAVYYAYWQGDGSLATTIASSSQGESSSGSSSPISSTPSDPTSIYLKANVAPVNWPEANAKIYLFVWNAPTTVTWPGYEMNAMGDGLYRYDLSFTPTDLLFARINPNNVTETWNQTVDLMYTAPNNLFTLTSWDNGVWSVYQTNPVSSSSSSTSETLTSTTIESSVTDSSSDHTTSSISQDASSTPPSSEATSSVSTSSSSVTESTSITTTSSPNPTTSVPISSEPPPTSDIISSNSGETISSSSESTLSSSSEFTSSEPPVVQPTWYVKGLIGYGDNVMDGWTMNLPELVMTAKSSPGTYDIILDLYQGNEFKLYQSQDENETWLGFETLDTYEVNQVSPEEINQNMTILAHGKYRIELIDAIEDRIIITRIGDPDLIPSVLDYDVYLFVGSFETQLWDYQNLNLALAYQQNTGQYTFMNVSLDSGVFFRITRYQQWINTVGYRQLVAVPNGFLDYGNDNNILVNETGAGSYDVTLYFVNGNPQLIFTRISAS
jgi:hypothetical protein